MTTLKQIIYACMIVCALLATAAAQEITTAQRSSLTITAAATGDERVRITAPSSVVQLRVEIYAAGGEKLFDQEIRGGNVFDWHLQDGQAQRLAPGTYVCVVTAKSISGKLTQKIGAVSVEEKSASVQPADSQKLSVQQTQAIGPVEENSSWTIAAQDEPQTPTVIANDGTDGQMIRGRGALTFRIGNFFSGIDQEQMRLTEDGRLGIGTSNPQAQLDVAGTIRAQRFLVAKPNKPGSDIKAQAGNSDSVQPLVAGTGTQDRIAKWTDNAGTLGDSSITETGGNVGIGTTTPGSKLVVSANTATLPPASGVARFADADGVQTAVFADAFGTNPIFNVRRANGTAAAPSAVQANQLLGVIGASGYGALAYMGTRARVAFWASEMWTNTANGTYLTFNTTANGAATPGGTERMRIDNAGNVGIGTSTPTRAKLETQGAVGNTVALFGGDGTGVALVRDYPFIGFNSYFNSGWKAISPGFGGHVGIEQSDGAMTFYVNGNAASANAALSPVEAMRIDQSGNVGIGTTSPSSKLSVNGGAAFSGNVGVNGGAAFSGNVGIGTTTTPGGVIRLQVKTTGPGDFGIEVLQPNGASAFIVRGDGSVHVGSFIFSSTTHVCDSAGELSSCSSAAEYVPTMDDGLGLVETADLVSIAPTVKNPYGDEHSPFVVTKSAKPCDDNLLGFIVKPESGADGKKVNEHYLPLAIYGYFPAKVTTENGPIKRGDPITSSSKPGYGMKATQACKIIGYALEDAEQEGKIQVFAHLGEYTAPAVVALQAQVRQLRRDKSRQVEAPQTQSAGLQARLNALEQAVQRNTENSSLVTRRRSPGTKPKSTPPTSRRLVHSKAISKSQTVSSGA